MKKTVRGETDEVEFTDDNYLVRVFRGPKSVTLTAGGACDYEQPVVLSHKDANRIAAELDPEAAKAKEALKKLRSAVAAYEQDYFNPAVPTRKIKAILKEVGL